MQSRLVQCICWQTETVHLAFVSIQQDFQGRFLSSFQYLKYLLHVIRKAYITSRKLENLLDPGGVENDAYARPRTLTSYNLDLWHPDPKVDHFIIIIYLFSKMEKIQLNKTREYWTRRTEAFTCVQFEHERTSFHVHEPWTTCVNWHQNRFIFFTKYRIYKLGNGWTDGRTDGYKTLCLWPVYGGCINTKTPIMIHCVQKKHPLLFSCITCIKSNQFEWKFQTK